MNLSKILLGFCASLLLSGCLSTNVMKDVQRNAKELRKGPKELPVRNVTSFSESLRCMDDLFLSFGISRGDYVIMAEELRDKTKKVDAGTREMMFSAISEMTERSHALKTITYGADTGNLISFLSAAGNNGVYQNIPAFDIIGSISQYDDSVYKKQADRSAELAGTNDGSTVGGGGGQSTSSSVTFMTVDLSVITSHNLALLPGVSTRNSVSLYNRGDASSYDAGISKTGVSYSLSSNTKDAVGQSLRGLIELSVIELMGKLVKVPYWSCLGMDAQHVDIQNEVSDWFFQLSQTGILHRTLKIQLALRGLYNGAIDEQVNQEYLTAVVNLKQLLGLPATPDIDLAFYSAFLNQVPVSIDTQNMAYANVSLEDQLKDGDAQAEQKDARVVASAEIKSKPKTPSRQTATKQSQPALELNIESDIDLNSASVGDKLNLSITANQEGNLACYFQRGDAMVRVFPNRFSKSSLLPANAQLQLPNANVYSFLVDAIDEHIHCFLTPVDIEQDVIAAELPSELAVEDFAPIESLTISDVLQAYQKATSNKVAYNSIQFGGN